MIDNRCSVQHKVVIVRTFSWSRIPLLLFVIFPLLNMDIFLGKIVLSVVGKSTTNCTTSTTTAAVTTATAMSEPAATASEPAAAGPAPEARALGDADLAGDLLADHPGPLHRDGLALPPRHLLALRHRHCG